MLEQASKEQLFIAKSRRKVHANLYLFFKMCMGNEALEPQDVLHFPHYHLVYDSTHPSVKEVILKCFISSSVPIRIVICTIAFGMGVNPPDMTHHPLWFTTQHCGLHSR